MLITIDKKETKKKRQKKKKKNGGERPPNSYQNGSRKDQSNFLTLEIVHNSTIQTRKGGSKRACKITSSRSCAGCEWLSCPLHSLFNTLLGVARNAGWASPSVPVVGWLAGSGMNERKGKKAKSNRAKKNIHF